MNRRPARPPTDLLGIDDLAVSLRERGIDAGGALAALVATARSEGLSVPDSSAMSAADLTNPDPAITKMCAEAIRLFEPTGPGRLLDLMRTTDDKRRTGACFTPPGLARRLVSLAFDRQQDNVSTVCDPMCGGGVFLFAVGDEMLRRGSTAKAVLSSVVGHELDPLSVAAAELGWVLWTSSHEIEGMPRLVVGDAIDSVDLDASFDLVIGNPPFLGQLRAETARPASETERIGQRLGLTGGAYTDTAALFLALGLDLVRPGGVVIMIQPQSTVSARDCAPVRAWIDERADLVGMWRGDGSEFAAAVHVVAPLLVRRAEPSNTEIDPAAGVDTWIGASVEPGPRSTRSGSGWANVLADLDGVPQAPRSSDRTLGDDCVATAGFRDQFYGIRGAVYEEEAADYRSSRDLRLVTAGLVDPSRNLWGIRAARYDRVDYQQPWVRRELLSGAPAAWADDRGSPKVVVATQTKVIEAFVDPDGRTYPLTPLLCVTSDRTDLWEVLAVLLSPPASVWMLRQSVGSGLSAAAIRPTATLLRLLPWPAPSGAGVVREAADLLRRTSIAPSGEPLQDLVVDAQETRSAVVAAARLTTEAYGDSAGVFDWWYDRLPPVR